MVILEGVGDTRPHRSAQGLAASVEGRTGGMGLSRSLPPLPDGAGTDMEQDPAAPATPHPHTMSSAGLLPVENFNQRIRLIREVRNAETKTV